MRHSILTVFLAAGLLGPSASLATSCLSKQDPDNKVSHSLCFPNVKPGTPFPYYPADERRANHQGRVQMDLCITPEGATESAALNLSSGFDALDKSALEWAKNASWTPATLDGLPSRICYMQSFFFFLTDPPVRITYPEGWTRTDLFHQMGFAPAINISPDKQEGRP